MAKPFHRSAPLLSTLSQQAQSAARQMRSSGLALWATCQRASGHKTHRAWAVEARGQRAPGVVHQAEVAVAPQRLHPLIEGCLEARLAASVTRKSWAARSVWPRWTSQGGLGVPSEACSSVELMAWPHMDPCLGMGRPWDRQISHHPTNASSQLQSSAPSFSRSYCWHCHLFHTVLKFISSLL